MRSVGGRWRVPSHHASPAGRAVGLDGADASTDGGGVVHPHTPGAGLGSQHRGGQRGGVALLGRAQGVVGGGEQAAQEGLAGGADEHRQTEADDPVEAGEQRPVVLGALGEAEPGSRTSCSGATPAATTSSTRAVSSAQTSVTTSPYCAAAYISRLCPRQCMSTHGTPASATSSAMFLSASRRSRR
jgi:hypothetical protein